MYEEHGVDTLPATWAAPLPSEDVVIGIKRVYEPPHRSDGQRILVECLWPRGMKKEALAADAWMKDVAPSTALRMWFAHRIERWEGFRRRYERELRANPSAWQPIIEASQRGAVTLLYSAHDTRHNAAVVLRDSLLRGQNRRFTARARPPSKRSAATFGVTNKSARPVRIGNELPVRGRRPPP